MITTPGYCLNECHIGLFLRVTHAVTSPVEMGLTSLNTRELVSLISARRILYFTTDVISLSKRKACSTEIGDNKTSVSHREGKQEKKNDATSFFKVVKCTSWEIIINDQNEQFDLPFVISSHFLRPCKQMQTILTPTKKISSFIRLA